MGKKYRQPEHTIPLFNYQYHHSPIANDFQKDDRFIGRTRLVDEIHDLLTKTKDSRGTYLITGYRGSGKTSLINKCIARYKRENRTTLPVRVNLGNDTPLEPKTALKQIVYELYTEVQKKLEEETSTSVVKSYSLYSATAVILSSIATFLLYCMEPTASTSYLLSRILLFVIITSTTALIGYSIYEVYNYLKRADIFKSIT